MRKSLTALAAATTLAAAALPAQAAEYAIDPTHTFASFEIDHFGASVNRVRFDKKDGKVQFDRAAKTGRVEIHIDPSSLSSGTPVFDGHLKGANHFNVEKFPTISFVGDKFSFDGDKVSEVAGQLTVKGKTHPVTLKARQFNCYDSPMLKREVCGGVFEATIDRTLWDLGYGLGMVAGKDVRLIAQIEAIKQ